MYCVYLTIYKGNNLPPFYIGSTSIDKIDGGYHGSVMSEEYRDIWKMEIKNNPHLFKTIIIQEFKKRKDAYQKEEKIHRHLKVDKNPLYINKSIAVANGKFGSGFSGKKHTKERNQKLSEKTKGIPRPHARRKRPDHSKRMKGKNNPMFGIRGEKHPLFKKQRTDRFCCLFCKRETIKSNLKHHLKCVPNISTSLPLI
jgi:hypothetical protein